MTNKEKLNKIKELADNMAHSSEYLLSDASHLHKAVYEYRQFIIQHWNEEEPVSEDLEEAAIEYCGGNTGADARVRAGFVMGGNWQREQMMKDALDGKVVVRFPLASEPRYVDVEIFVKYAQNLNEDDKVKVIIIKEAKYDNRSDK